ncbi:glycoside hydrolase family 127 protein [Mucilaginibacter puniceus]
MIKQSFAGILLITALSATAQVTTNAKLQEFKLQDVTLLPGIFKSAETTDLHYIMEMKPDRLLAPYLREAGLKPKAESYGNWENTGLDGHIGGHYLTALALMYASNGNKEALTRLNYMIDELKKCQDANGDGYVGGVPGSKELWAAVNKGDVDAIKKKWVPFYNIHKTFAGLRDAYLYTGNQTAKAMFIKFGDWFVDMSKKLTGQQIQQMLQTEHGGINETLADVYALTGDKKYLTAAYAFSHEAVLKPLEAGEDKLTGLHANTQIPKIIGFKRIADLNDDKNYEKAAENFWDNVVEHRTVAIGGNSVSEHFNPINNFSSMINSVEGPETCNTNNMLKLTTALFLSDPKVSYMDYYERALYNHILSSQHPGNGGFVYFTPMRPGHYRVYSQPQEAMWCCVGTGIENHAKYGELIYAHDKNDLYVNLFIPSKLNWKQKGVTITQQTTFPEEEKTNLTINEVKVGSTFAINVRYPSWVKPGGFKILVNGNEFKTSAQPSTYVAIKKAWKKGDVITIQLPMQTKMELLPDGSNFEAVVHGPIVLAAKLNENDLTRLMADDSRMGHVAPGKQYPLQEMPMFVSSNTTDDASLIKPIAGQPLTYSVSGLVYPAKYNSLKLIPFYKLHDSRYVIYWEKETPQSIIPIQQKLAESEAAAAKLRAMTVDLVMAGEQQPESDHFIESDNSTTGLNRTMHYRNAKGWFSYNLIDKNKEASALRVTYFGRDRNKQFSILINDKPLAKVALDGSKGNDFYTVDYPITEDLLRSSNGTLKVKFLAADGSTTGDIYEVRLMKK